MGVSATQQTIFFTKTLTATCRPQRFEHLRLNASPRACGIALDVEDVRGPRVVIESYIIRRAVNNAKHETVETERMVDFQLYAPSIARTVST